MEELNRMLDREIGIPGLQLKAIMDTVSKLVDASCKTQCNLCTLLHPDKCVVEDQGITLDDIEAMLDKIGIPTFQSNKIMLEIYGLVNVECEDQCGECNLDPLDEENEENEENEEEEESE